MSRIVIGLSGGVDSALAAALLQERGWEVIGCFLKVNLTTYGPQLTTCPWREDLPMAHRVAAHLNIPLIVRDVGAEYEREVLEPMIAAYRAGETPNPDILCNRWVKFDALRTVACEVGADRIATGHYARVVHNTQTPDVIASRVSRSEAEPRAGAWWEATSPPRVILSRSEGSHINSVGYVELYRGLDHTKDQSYFLTTLTKEQLAACEFPLGEWLKTDVRAAAKRRGLPNWDRHSTSGVCFIGHTNIAEFLSLSLRGSAGDRSNPGHESPAPATVVTTAGEVIGTVPVGEALTIGQRAPIAGQSAPRYVVAQEVSNSPTLSVGETRRVIVSATPEDPARFVSEVSATNPHWIGSTPTFPLHCSARIRHRQEPMPCIVSTPSSFRASSEESHTAVQPSRERMTLHVTFTIPLTGVAPGQAIVFSDSDRILGAATIDAR